MDTNEKTIRYDAEDPNNPSSELENTPPLTNTGYDDNAAQFAASSVGVGVWGVVLFAATAIMLMLATAVPLAINNGLLVMSLSLSHEVETQIASFPDHPENRAAMAEDVHWWESTKYLFLTLVQTGLIVFDSVLGIFYLLFYFFWNLAVFIFKAVFIPLLDLIKPLLTDFARLAVSAITSISGSFGSGVETGNGSGNADYFGSANGSAIGRIFHVLFAIIEFVGSMDDKTWHELVNFVMDPFLKTLPSVYKTIANYAGMVGKAGTWTKLLSGAINLRGITNKLEEAACKTDVFFSNLWCSVENTWYSICKALRKVGIKFSCNKCDYKHNSDCKTAGDAAPVESSIPPDFGNGLEFVFGSIGDFFGIGLCDEFLCMFGVQDVAVLMQNSNGSLSSCPAWTSDPYVVYDCMLFVTRYASVNSTGSAKSSLAGIASEICIVMFAYNTKSCTDYSQPFVFDLELLGQDICNNTRYGASYSECSCNFETPLCDQNCCDLYGNHVHQQVVAQLGTYTCQSLNMIFTEERVFCPNYAAYNATVQSDSPFPDNLYAFMWCAYFRYVLKPTCDLYPLNLISGLEPTLSLLVPSYQEYTCNRTVNQIGVCMAVNTTLDDLALAYVKEDRDTVDIFAAIAGTVYVPNQPIPTDFFEGDTELDLFHKNLNKHYCNEFSQLNRNDNIILKSQPWRVYGMVGEYCDNAMTFSGYDMDLIGVNMVYKYRKPNGNPLVDNLDGVPEQWMPFFGTGADSCDGDIGLNIEEKGDFDKCTESLRGSSYDVTAQIDTATTDTLYVFEQQTAQTRNFAYISGLEPIDPNSTAAAGQQMQMRRQTETLNSDIDFYDYPYYKIPNVTEAERIYVPFPPEDGSPDDDDPGAAFRGQNVFGGSSGSSTYGGSTVRMLLSYNEDNEPMAPDYLGEIYKYIDKKMPAKKSTGDSGSSYTERLVALAQGLLGKPTVHDRAFAYVTERRVLRNGDRIYHELYGKHVRAFEDAGHVMDEADYFPHTRRRFGMRRLQMTGDIEVDSTINLLFDSFVSAPQVPEGMTVEEYNAALQQNVLDMLTRLFLNSMFTTLPRVVIALYTFANIESGDPAAFVNITLYNNFTEGAFGSSSYDPTCRPTAADPYRCCTPDATAYECCKGLIFCLPLIPEWVFPGKTTAENVEERYKCEAFRTWGSYWKTIIKIVVSILASIFGSVFNSTGVFSDMVLTQDEVPPNAFDCAIIYSYWMFATVDILFLIWIFLSSQMLVMFAAIYANFRAVQDAKDSELRNIYANIRKLKEEMPDRATGYMFPRNMSHYGAQQRRPPVPPQALQSSSSSSSSSFQKV